MKYQVEIGEFRFELGKVEACITRVGSVKESNLRLAKMITIYERKCK